MWRKWNTHQFKRLALICAGSNPVMTIERVKEKEDEFCIAVE
jgi:hypothetical protein